MFGLKKKRRERIRNRPFPEAWADILEKHVAHYRRLASEDQTELRGHIQVFLDEKTFEGCGGLEMSDEIRVVIAAQACILLLHRDTDYYPALDTILVYPHQYFSPGIRQLSEGVVAEGLEGRLGESWYRGPVVLSGMMCGGRPMTTKTVTMWSSMNSPISWTVNPVQTKGPRCCRVDPCILPGPGCWAMNTSTSSASWHIIMRQTWMPTAPPTRQSFSPWLPRLFLKNRSNCSNAIPGSTSNWPCFSGKIRQHDL